MTTTGKLKFGEVEDRAQGCPNGCGPLDAPSASPPDTAIYRFCKLCGYAVLIEDVMTTTRNSKFAGREARAGAGAPQSNLTVVTEFAKVGCNNARYLGTQSQTPLQATIL